MAKPKNLANVCEPDVFTSFGRGGGKSAGSQATPTEAPNTLIANSLAKIVEVLSEGEIVGLVDGSRSVYFNGVPLQNADDTFNFEGVAYAIRYGTPEQAHIPGFESIETETPVSTEATFGVPVVRRITNPLADRVKVTITIPALTELDTDSGDLNGASVAIAIDIKSDADDGGAVYVEKVVDYIYGKCTSTYPRSYDLYLTGPAPWDIRLRRITADSGVSTLQNQTYFGSYTEIIDEKVAYADTAVAGVRVNAELFGNNVPERAYEIYGVKIQYPSNYNPTTGVYTGVWDGLFTTGYCNNPAWVFYDLLTHTRYGAGIDEAFVDKWGLYAIAQYCDELVSDGYGGTERRFVFNGVVTTREEAYKVLQSVASTFRSMIYYSAGGVYVAQDRPGPVERIFNDSNVVGGFNYSSSARSARHTVAHVQWLNPAFGYEPDIEVVEDRAQILKYGYRVLEISAYGTTSRGQAYRAGKWAVLTEKLESESVQFTVSYDNADCLPGEIIKIVDRSRTDVNIGGRSSELTTTVLTSDQTVTLDGVSTYTIFIQLNDDTVHESEVVGVTGGVDIELADAIDGGLLPASGTHVTWLLVKENTEPRYFRVMKISEEDEGNLYRIFAMEHDADKADLVDNSLSFEPDDYNYLPNFSAVPSPENLDVWFSPRRRDGKIRMNATVSWDPVDSPLLRGYLVSYQFGKNNWSIPIETSQNSLDLPDLAVGEYRFKVTPITRTGLKGAPAGIVIALDIDTASRTPISNLYVNGTTDVEFSDIDCSMAWTAAPLSGLPAANTDDGADPFFSHFEIKVYDGDHAVLRGTYKSLLPIFIYTWKMNVNAAGGPVRTLSVDVRSVDVFGRKSNPTNAVFVNPAPEIPGSGVLAPLMTYRGGGGNRRINFPVSDDPDFVAWRVYYFYSDAILSYDLAALEPYKVYEGPGPADFPVETAKTVQAYVIYSIDSFGLSTDREEFSVSVLSSEGALAGTTLGGYTAADFFNSSNQASGTLPIARLGSSGTPSSSTFLRGDNTWATVTGFDAAADHSPTGNWSFSTGAVRFESGIFIGPATNAGYIYGSLSDSIGVRSGASGSYKYFRFNEDGDFNVLNGGLTATGASSFSSTVSITGVLTLGTYTGLATAAGFKFRGWNSSDTDIDALIGGTASGGIIEGPSNAHLVFGIKGNDSTDGIYVLDTGNGGAVAYTQVILALTNNNFQYKTNDIFHAGAVITGDSGTAALPAFSFDADPNTGFYLFGADQIGIAAGGAARFVVSTGHLYGNSAAGSPALTYAAGTAGAPAFSFLSDLSTGMFRQAAGVLGFAVAGTERIRVRNNNVQTLELLGQINLTTALGTLRSKIDWGITQSGLTISNEDNSPISLRTSATTRFTIADASITATVPILAAAGSEALPSYAFAGDTNTGFYSSSADAIGVSLGGSRVLNFETAGISLVGITTESKRIEIGTGRSGNGYAYIDLVGDATYSDYGLRIIRDNTGANAATQFLHRGTGNLDFFTQEAAAMRLGTSGVTRLTIASGGNISFTGVLLGPAGSAGAPTFSFSTDPDTGFYSGGANIMSLSVGGTNRWNWNTAALYSGAGTGAAALAYAVGSASAPAFYFVSDSDTGIYRVSADVIGFACGGVARGSLNNSGIWSGADFSATSDIRLKKDVAPLEYGLDTVRAMRAKRFAWTEDGRIDIGFIAQQMRKLVPEAVNSEPMFNGLKNVLSISYGKLATVNIVATQELDQEVQKLKQEIAELVDMLRDQGLYKRKRK